jgi:hypothetical protein
MDAPMSDRNPTSVVLPVAVALVMLSAYVGAYYAMVQPIRVEWGNGFSASATYPSAHAK